MRRLGGRRMTAPLSQTLAPETGGYVYQFHHPAVCIHFRVSIRVSKELCFCNSLMITYQKYGWFMRFANFFTKKCEIFIQLPFLFKKPQF